MKAPSGSGWKFDADSDPKPLPEEPDFDPNEEFDAEAGYEDDPDEVEEGKDWWGK